jgi:hypothetical protein
VDINDAAQELHEKLAGFDWFGAVAVGGLDDKEVIFVYTTKAVKNKWIERLNREGWRGFDVKVEKVGRAAPALR